MADDKKEKTGEGINVPNYPLRWLLANAVFGGILWGGASSSNWISKLEKKAMGQTAYEEHVKQRGLDQYLSRGHISPDPGDFELKLSTPVERMITESDSRLKKEWEFRDKYLGLEYEAYNKNHKRYKSLRTLETLSYASSIGFLMLGIPLFLAFFFETMPGEDKK